MGDLEARTPLTQRRPVFRGLVLGAVLIWTAGAGACTISAPAELRKDWYAGDLTGDLALVVPYVLDGSRSFYDEPSPKLSGVPGLGGVGLTALVGLAFIAADTADKSDISRHLSVFEVDGKQSINARNLLLLAPGRHRIGVKHCHDGALRPPCSLMVYLEFEARGGVAYELVLMEGGGVLLKEKESGLPAAWGSALAATSEGYKECLVDGEIRRNRMNGPMGDGTYDVVEAASKAKERCRRAHPDSYRALIAG